MARRIQGLWLVQLLEYGIGFAVASTAAHAPEPLSLIVLALILIGNAACVDGPLSAFRFTSASTHRLLGIVIAVGATACAVVLPVSVTDRATLLAVAGAEAFVSVRFGHGI